ncbi:MAG: WYL domain-containing protein [Candidatus Aminicenantes bacterium]|nr:WYL domain-containing protein [Candidatus Aminicenantes bacterium]
MAKKLAFERYLWFHARLKQKKFPKLKDLVEMFEISNRQAAREIEFMRDFFSAPIEYSAEENGYYYSEESFELPGVWVSEEEIISMIISKRLTGTIPNPRIKKKIDSFFEKIYSHAAVDLSNLEKKVSIKNIRYYRVKPAVFEAVVFGLSKDRKLEINYHSVYRKGVRRRVIHPLHMLLYMGNWHLFAFCETRKEMRNFVLSRIGEVEILEERVDEQLKQEDIKKLIEESYGIFLTGEKTEVTLKFSPEVAPMVKDQVWFPGQEFKECEDKSIILKFPVSDFREVERDIMGFGPGVEVLAPPELRDIIRANITGMAALYKNRDPLPTL